MPLSNATDSDTLTTRPLETSVDRKIKPAVDACGFVGYACATSSRARFIRQGTVCLVPSKKFTSNAIVRFPAASDRYQPQPISSASRACAESIENRMLKWRQLHSFVAFFCFARLLRTQLTMDRTGPVIRHDVLEITESNADLATSRSAARCACVSADRINRSS